MAALLLEAWSSGEAVAQDAPPLRAGEPFDVGEAKVTVLGMSISEAAAGRRVVLRVRVQSSNRELPVTDTSFRLMAGGVPRAPAMFSYLLQPEAAEDFPVTFTIPDATNDLVLQVRFRTNIERRRLPTS